MFVEKNEKRLGIMKKKALYFFQYLPPWKIDVFNGMAREYDLTVVFFDIDRKGFTYDRDDLLHRLNGVGVEVLSGGLSILGHYLIWIHYSLENLLIVKNWMN